MDTLDLAGKFDIADNLWQGTVTALQDPLKIIDLLWKPEFKMLIINHNPNPKLVKILLLTLYFLTLIQKL